MLDIAKKALADPRKALQTIAHRLLAPMGGHHYTPFIVLCRSRTGSNLLKSFLDSHPRLHMRAEIFRTLEEDASPQRITARAFPREPFYIRASGFKIFYYHPLNDASDRVWRELRRRPDLKVIHLTRKNILRTLVSREIAGRTRVWAEGASYRNRDASKSVRLSVEEAKQGFEQTERWQEEARRTFGDHSLVEVCYEDLVARPQQEVGRLLDFLGLPHVEPKTKLRRQNPEPLDELLLNYDELASAFSKTRWQRFFAD